MQSGKQQINTINYYEENAQAFVSATIDVDFGATQERFLQKLQKGAWILDFGCGSGRDTRHFLERGYQVTAIDGSEKLCKWTEGYTGIPVKCMLFQELADVEAYDGIWACSSILHLTCEELVKVMLKMSVALKNRGVIYTSFKYGTFEGERDGRYFTDMTEERFAEILQKIETLKLEEQWRTSDVRPGREKEQWLNIILRKI